MALEWVVPVGFAVAKLLLRASSKTDIADAISDVQQGWSQWRQLGRRPDVVGRVISERLDQRLAGISDQARIQDLQVAASDVADLISRLADDDEAVRIAAAHPDQLLDYLNKKGARRLRGLTAAHATSLFDEILEAAAQEFTMLAPSSPRFLSASLVEVYRLAELLPDIAENTRLTREAVDRFLAAATSPGINWPLIPVPAPAMATAFQPRAIAERIPASGTVVLSGSTGFGKTQLATKIFSESTADLRLWVPANTLSGVQDAYASAAVVLGLADREVTADERARLFLSWLMAESRRRWLVVLDDLVEPASLYSSDINFSWWPPMTRAGLTVVTTQSRHPELTGEGRTRLNIGCYTADEAVSYLTECLGSYLDELPEQALTDADRLAHDLGYHPLALAQAAAVILADAVTVRSYRERLASQHLEQVLPDTARADSYPRTLYATWALALNRASRLSPHAGPLLTLLALLDPNGVPDTLVATQASRMLLSRSGHSDEEDRMEPSEEQDPATADQARAALRVLHQLSLTTHTPRLGARAIRTHPLTARITREHTTDEFAKVVAGLAADALLEIWPEIEKDTTLATTLRANAATLTGNTAPAFWISGSGIHRLAFRYGRSLGRAGLVHSALQHFAELTATARQVLGPDHPHTLTSRANLANFRGEAGDTAGAAQAFEELLADCLRVLGPSHPHTIAARANVANLRGEAGDTVGATRAYEELLADCLRILGPDHPHTLATRANVAHFRGAAGDAVGAAQAYEELLADYLRVLGPDHPDTLASRSYLARWRGEAGDPVGAAEALEELLADRLRVLGPDHPDTLTTRGNLARSRGQAGDPVGAVQALEQLLADCLRVLGPDHPATLTTRGNLAQWRWEAGDAVRAGQALEELLADYRRVLGPDHPDTLATRGNLAQWRWEAGDPAGAAQALEKLLADRLRVLGPDHPDTLTTRGNLAVVRGEAGDPAGIRALEKLLADRLRVLGPDYPDTTRAPGPIGS